MTAMLRRLGIKNCSGRTKGRGRSSGFTLLEVMIAVGILAIGLVILLEAHVMNMRLAGHCGLRTRAVLLAEKKMAELESRKVSPAGERKGCFEGADSGFTWKELITPVVVGNQVLTGISRAEVVVSWDGGQREENVSLVTYVVP